jgi:hypothetical protein
MRFLLFIFSIVLLVSCKKAEDRECMKSAGKQTSLEIALSDFKKLRVGPKIEVVLVQGAENKLVVHGRENVIKHISHDINEEGVLMLVNNNRCNFLRSFEKNKVKVEVHFIDLNDLFFEGTFDLTTKGVINTNNIKLNIQDGGATVYLQLNCYRIEANQGHGYGDFVLSGECHDANLRVTSNGFADATGLKVNNELIVISNTPVSSSVNVDGAKTTIEIGGSGNVKYIGQPLTMKIVKYGTGQLINVN